MGFGVEPKPLVLQTSVQTRYTIPRNTLGAVVGVEPTSRAYETRRITGRTPH